ncbi:MAG: CARDB domain-containing protein, partial [bacterium]
LTATNATGTFNLRAFVDADNATPEQSEGDNQSTLTYTFAPGGGGSGYTGKPDFAITAITTEPAMLTPGCAFTTTVALVNYGLAAGDAGVLRMWLDHPAAATNQEAGGVELPVGALAMGGTTNIIFTGLTATNATGTFNLRAFVDADNATPELSEGNNQSVMTYTFAPGGGSGYTGKPDFAITAITTEPAMLTPGCSFTATVAVVNYGLAAGDAGVLRMWLNHPAAATNQEAGGVELPVGALELGGTTNIIFTGLTATNATGTFNLRAFVDADNATPELSEGNNQSVMTYTFAPGGGGSFDPGANSWSRPDFTVTELAFVGAAPSLAGEPFTVRVTVANRGLVAGNGGTLYLFASKADWALPGSEASADTNLTVGVLAAAGARTFDVQLPTPSARGVHHLRAYVVSPETEWSTGDNQSSIMYGLQTVQVSIEMVPGVGVVVTWNNYWGDTYTVYRKADLSGTFEPLATNIPSARPAEQNVFIDANPPAGGAALYKVGASAW